MGVIETCSYLTSIVCYVFYCYVFSYIFYYLAEFVTGSSQEFDWDFHAIHNTSITNFFTSVTTPVVLL